MTLGGRVIVRFFAALAAIWILFPSSASAFPENVRHGYVNCTSCHVAPSGGGLLTPYGRSLSSELISTWSYKGEEGVLHGLIKEGAIPDAINLGGDLRAAQTWRSTSLADEARWVKMQADLEASLRFGRLTLDGTFGRIYERTGDSWGSRRYYLMYNLTDEVTVRAGRFYAVYGLLVPDHYATTRRDLGFDQNQETNNVEAAWVGESWNVYATVVASPGETQTNNRETALSVQVNRAFLDRFKVGASAWAGTASSFSRQMLGVHGILGFTDKLFLLSEVDHQWRTLKDADQFQRGIFTFNRLGYEVFKGFNVFGQAEYSQQDLANGGSTREGYGPGFQFFPRPHFEITGVWEKSRQRALGTDFGDFAFLLLHYYL